MMQEKYPTDYQCYVQFAYLYTDMEGRKAENERDYTKVKENYELAITYAPDGENTSEIMQLSALISELEEKGWL